MNESTKKEKTSVVALRAELVEARKEIVRLKSELDELSIADQFTRRQNQTQKIDAC